MITIQPTGRVINVVPPDVAKRRHTLAKDVLRCIAPAFPKRKRAIAQLIERGDFHDAARQLSLKSAGKTIELRDALIQIVEYGKRYPQEDVLASVFFVDTLFASTIEFTQVVDAAVLCERPYSQAETDAITRAAVHANHREALEELLARNELPGEDFLTSVPIPADMVDLVAEYRVRWSATRLRSNLANCASVGSRGYVTHGL